jgi:hypothetical protein
MNEFYASHSTITDPGRYAFLFDDLPQDLAGISRVAQGLVYHYVADQYIYGYVPPSERMPEIDTRYMEAMLARLIEMDNRPLSEPRAYEHRLVGCCRDFSLLACAILRHQGTPARLRYGFSGYFDPGYWGDHVVVEAWNGTRWQRFDPELPPAFSKEFSVLDMPDHVFATGGRAWQMCRDEGADPARFGLGPKVPEVSGWWFIRGRLQLDLAALNKQEMLCWDQWAYADEESVVSEDEEALLDSAATLSLEADSTIICALWETEPRLQPPATVTCFSPAQGSHPVTVRLSR